MTQIIKIEPLRDLAEAGGVKGATIVGQKGGFAVVAKIGMKERPLGTRQGSVRMFGRLDTAVRTLRELGLMQFDVDISNYEEGRLRPPRPDTKKRHAAAADALAHDRWFRTKVQESLDKIESGTAVFHDHDQVWDELEAYASELTAQRDAGAAKPQTKPRRASKKAG